MQCVLLYSVFMVLNKSQSYRVLVVVVVGVDKRNLLLQLLLLAGKQRVDRGIELVPALEEIEFEDENVANDVAAELLDERAGCRCGTACDTIMLAVSVPCMRLSTTVLSRPRENVPVAMMSSTTSTFCPCLTTSAWIWKKSLPYSF